eukprot:527865-Amphidinium_carterae.1
MDVAMDASVAKCRTLNTDCHYKTYHQNYQTVMGCRHVQIYLPILPNRGSTTTPPQSQDPRLGTFGGRFSGSSGPWNSDFKP